MTLASGGAPSARARSLSRGAQIAIVVVAAVVLILLLIVLPATLRALGHKPEAAPPPPPPGTFAPTPEQWRALTLTPVRTEDFAATVSTEGKIATDDDLTVVVTPPLSGRVRAVFAKLGDRVARGQALLSIESTEVAQGQSDLATANSNLVTAEAQLRLAQAAAVRQRALFKISGNALKDVQQAESDLAGAADTVSADEAAAAAVRNRFAILQASAHTVAGGAAATVNAPIAGVVTQRAVGPGQFLNATQNGSTASIFTVSDLSKVWLVAEVREEDVAQMRRGLPVRVQVPAWPGRTFRGVVDYVAPTIDPATRRLAVRAVVANSDGALKPEMFAGFTITAGAGERALAVPTSGVLYEGETARVWVSRPDHTLALRLIRTGRTLGDQVEVLGGLDPNDQVVTSGAIFIDRAAKTD